MRTHRLPAVIGVALAIVLAPRAAQAQAYQVVPIDTLPGTRGVTLTDLNNQLQGVGYTYYVPFASELAGPAVLWDPVNGTRPFPVSNVVGPLAINNEGLIVGTQRFGRTYQLFSLRGSDYRQLPTPPGTKVEVIQVTDSGIVLINTGSLCGTGNGWALYQSQLYDLRSLGLIRGVGEDGTLIGARGEGVLSFNQVPLRRTLDGREAIPWIDFNTVITTIGPGGHFAGAECTLGSRVIHYGQPDGSAIEIAAHLDLYSERAGFGLRLYPRSINRRGDLVGRAHDSCVLCPQDRRDAVFLYGDGRVTDLVDLARLPASLGVFYDVRKITDDGAILATTTTGRDASGIEIFVDVLLLPDGVPLPPTGVSFTVSGQGVTLQWRSQSDATDYIVQAGHTPGASDFFDQSVGAQPAVSGVVPPGRYYVRVRARIGARVSEPSQEIVIDVP